MLPLKAVKSRLSPPLEASSLKCALSASVDPPHVILLYTESSMNLFTQYVTAC